MSLKLTALSTIAAVAISVPVLSHANPSSFLGHGEVRPLESMKLAQQSQRGTRDSQVHSKMLHGDEEKSQTERSTAKTPSQNAPRAPVDPKAHEKMLHGDEQTPRLTTTKETNHQSKSRQEVIKDLSNQSPSEKARMKALNLG